MTLENVNAESKITKGTNILWSKSFIFLIIISLITAMGFNMVYVIISKYAMGIAASLTIAGVVSGIFSIAALVIRPFAGRTADIVNKKLLCIIANILIGISVVGYAFSPNISVLFFFRILHGVGFGISSTANIALVTEYIPKERLGEGIGYYGLGQVLAQVIGPNLGVEIADKYGFQFLFLVIALTTFLSAGMLAFLHYPKGVKTPNYSRIKVTFDSLIAKEVIVYAAIGGIFSFGNGIVSSFLILLGQERSISNIGLFFSVGAVVLFALRLFIGRIVDRQGLTIVVNISLVASAISMALIGVAPALGLLLVASVLKSIGQGGGQISLQAECIKRVDAGRVGVATSTFYIGADIGQGIGPIIGGAVSSYFNYTGMYLACAAIILVSMVFFNIYQRKIGHH
ncbi:MAG: MFS transporter [Clostridiaceae bacterium]|nr:MFS transporter [Clostridiaceae bacterium]